MDTVPVYILAGGRSSRFGSDKARACVDGTPLIVRLAAALRPVVSAVTVVADRPGKYADLGLHTIADRVPGQGPLGGLATALRHAAPAPWLLLVSCDLLEARVAWIAALRAQCRPGVQAVAFRPDSWQPLLALYHTALATPAEQALRAGRRALWQFLDAARAVAAPLPGDWPRALQANTRADLPGGGAPGQPPPSGACP